MEAFRKGEKQQYNKSLNNHYDSATRIAEIIGVQGVTLVVSGHDALRKYAGDIFLAKVWESKPPPVLVLLLQKYKLVKVEIIAMSRLLDILGNS